MKSPQPLRRSFADRAWRRLREFSGLASDATYLWPRWIMLRLIGLIFVIVFAGIIEDAPALIGPDGLVPLGAFFEESRQSHPQALGAFLHAPSLFWLSHSEAMIATLAWGGLAAAVALTLNLWPRMALFLYWLFFLSFVSTWRGFSASQVDQLMLEAALLCLPFAPAGFRPRLGHSSPPRPIAVFVVRWLLFRLMLESGLMKIFAGDPRWLNLTAMDVLYETAPFPTILGYYAHQLPHAFHVGEIALTFAAEIVAPLAAAFGGRRGRWFAFVSWTVFQIGIQLTNNFGWLNTASIGLGLILLDDQMLTALGSKLNLRFSAGDVLHPAQPHVHHAKRWPDRALRFALGTHFVLTIYFFAVNCGLPVEGFPYALGRPLKLVFWDFRSANAYTLYAGLLPARIGVDFEGSNDGGETWRTFPFRYQPQAPDQISPFLAPRYARFEATLQVEANRSERSPLFAHVASHLISRTPSVLKLFRSDPFVDRPPSMVRMPVHRLQFTDLATHRTSGNFWSKEFVGHLGPTLGRDEQGRIIEALSPLDETRIKAVAGNLAAQAKLGQAYAYGDGVGRDMNRAAEWFRKAADRGDPPSAFFVGLCYANGEGVPQDFSEAARFYRLAAMHGNPLAQANLGFLYLRGQGFARDDVEALSWFGVAARSGNKDAVRVFGTQSAKVDAATAAIARQRSDALLAEIEALQHRK